MISISIWLTSVTFSLCSGVFLWIKTTSSRWIHNSHSLDSQLPLIVHSFLLFFSSSSFSAFIFGLSLSLKGPHIASVTLAAYECGSVDFPEPPYPDQIICPQQNAPAAGSDAERVGVEAMGAEQSAVIQGSISLWTIISKVRLEACMWVSAWYTAAVHTAGGTANEKCGICTVLSLHTHFSWLRFGPSLDWPWRLATAWTSILSVCFEILLPSGENLISPKCQLIRQ